jgi:D-glycero-alpha-D-manno-heptose-7-phosphate kinase
MIITQTPLRMSFAGGGSDLPAYYRKFGGAVVSTAIDKFVYINVNQKFDHHVRVSYSRTEEVENSSQVEHPIVRAALQKLSIAGGLEITSIADIPSRGTGLGSSSSFTVGLLLALHAYHSRYISPGDLAHESCVVEMDLCHEPIGKQDGYAAVFGGLNFIRFEPDESVIVEPILCTGEALRRLQSSLVTFYTGKTRAASSILLEQSTESETSNRTQQALGRIVELAYILRRELNRGNIDALGEILHEGWINKRELNPNVSSPEIDEWYSAARRAGAVGGKLFRRGGGRRLSDFFRAARTPPRH